MDLNPRHILERLPLPAVLFDLGWLRGEVSGGTSPVRGANARALDFFAVPDETSLAARHSRLFRQDFIFELSRYVEDGGSSFVIDTVIYRGEQTRDVKIIVGPCPWDTSLDMVMFADISEYRLTEGQLFRQWLLHHTVIRLFMASINNESVETLLEFSLQEISEISRHSVAFCIYDFDGTTHLAAMAALADGGTETASIGIRAAIDAVMPLLFAEKLQRIIVPGVDSRFAEAASHIHDMLIHPIVLGERTIAVLGMVNKDEGYDFTDQQTFDTVGAALRELIIHKRDQRKLRQAMDELTALYEISTVLSSTIDARTLLPQLVESIRGLRIFSAPDDVRIFYSRDNLLYLMDPALGAAEGAHICADELCVGAYSAASIAFAPSEGSAMSAMAVPLLSSGRVVGVLELSWRGGRIRPDAGSLGVFYSAAKQIGLAIMNVMLYEETRILSLHDPLTGLGNRRRLEQVITDLAEGSGRRFAVIMADIDHFKEYNDSKGHEEGDRLLYEVASILRHEVRAVDTTTRYGGEEFLMVLPDVDEKGAAVIAERIRRAVMGATSVTVSLGVAGCGVSPCVNTEVIARADQALYAAKEGGRNAVRCHSEL